MMISIIQLVIYGALFYGSYLLRRISKEKNDVRYFAGGIFLLVVVAVIANIFLLIAIKNFGSPKFKY